MSNGKKILLVHSKENGQAREFVHSLKSWMPELDISIAGDGLTTFLFDAPKYDLVHLVGAADDKVTTKAARLRGKTRLIQTVTGSIISENAELIGDRIVVFSEHQRSALANRIDHERVHFIPPSVALSASPNLEPSGVIRARFKATDRLMVLALNDFSARDEFNAFLYICRELNRKDAIRFLIPCFRKDKDAILWRERLKASVQQERLEAVVFVDHLKDLSSLIDASDVTLYTMRTPPADFSFPLHVAEALLRGKPLICFNVPPVGPIVSSFRKSWAVGANEDFVREIRDIVKESKHLDDLSTDFVRHARTMMSLDHVANSHRILYKQLLQQLA